MKLSTEHILDVLAFGAHPDDVELCAGGTIAMMVAQGYRVGIVDLTRGELGSRGTAEIRAREASEAARILGVELRENLGFEDGNLIADRVTRDVVISAIRKHRPRILLTGAPECRHPDHGLATRITAEAAFYAGLRMISTSGADGAIQEPWRPAHVLHYMQALSFEPSFVVDVSDAWETRMRAIQAYRTQFHSSKYDSAPDEPETFISTPEFLDWIEARARTWGYRIGARYGEPFLYRHGPMATDDLPAFLSKTPRL